VRWISAAVVAVVLLFASQAGAVAVCSVATTPVDFGGYDTSLSFPTDRDGAVNVTCTSGVPYAIRIDAGTNSKGGFVPRKMRLSGGTYLLGYNLYRDSARTQIWGDGTGKTYIQTGTGTGVKQSIPVYGRLPGSQNVAVGAYGDALTVTVEW